MTRKTLLSIAAVILIGVPAFARVVMPPVRFPFKIDPKTPLAELLPVSPDLPAGPLPWQVKELKEVPEIRFEKAITPPAEALPEGFPKLSKEAQVKALSDLFAHREAAMKRTAHTIAKINHLNAKETDHFLKVLIKSRPDLEGLPFVMGADCRMSKATGDAFAEELNFLRTALSIHVGEEKAVKGIALGQSYLECLPKRESVPEDLKETEEFLKGRHRKHAQVATWMQVLGPETGKLRLDLVAFLKGVDHADAARALARLAVFSNEAGVRDAAIAALKSRPHKDYQDVLLECVRYPWPDFATNAGRALIALQCKDVVNDLIKVLEEPDPRAPTEVLAGETKKKVVREVVKLNHHRNCLLCHAPGNMPEAALGDFGRKDNVVTGPVPSPGQPIETSFRGYGRMQSPDILVRADVTYLRQDFSLMVKVADAAPWPEQQRFDFLVRTRAVSDEEAAGYEAWRREQGADYVAPHHQAAYQTLRGLTRRDAGRDASAWRKALGHVE